MDGLYTWTTWVVIITCLCTVTGSLEYTASSCFNQTEKTLPLTCPPGHMVQVTRMIQGINDQGQCGHSDGDCIYEMRHDSVSCTGQQTCHINLPSGNTGVRIHTCGAHASYMQVDYTCVNASDTVDICSSQDITDQYGYIATPFYPTNYPVSRNCSLYIATPFAHQKITIYAIDMRLETTTDTGCPDLLYLYDGHRSYTSCGSDARKRLMVTMENHLLLRFESNNINREKGFWLYYEASPYVNMSLEPSTTVSPTRVTVQPPVSTTSISSTHSTPVTTTDKPPPIGLFKDGNFSIGLLVGILVGIALCIMCIVILILYLKRRQQKMSEVMIGQNASIASMASSIQKPLPSDTLNNLDHPNKPHNEDSIEKGDEKDMEMDQKPEKHQYLGPFIESNLSTGEEQLIC